MIDSIQLGEMSSPDLAEQILMLRDIIADPGQLRRTPDAVDTLRAMQDELSVRAKRNAAQA